MQPIIRSLWIALCLTTGLPLAASASSLQVFKVENRLVGWTGYGLRNADGQVVVRPTPLKLTPLKGGGFLQEDWSNGARVLDAEGHPIGPTYDSIVIADPSLDSMILGKGGDPTLEGKGGLIDVHGKVIVAPTYQTVKYLKGTGLFLFERARRFGAMDARGNVVLPVIYDSLEAVGGALLVSRPHSEQALFDTVGKQLTPFATNTSYQDIKERTDRLVVCTYDYPEIRFNPHCRLVDSHFDQVVPEDFLDAVYLPASKHWLVKSAQNVADTPQRAKEHNYGDTAYSIFDDDGRRLASFYAEHAQRDGDLIKVEVRRPPGDSTQQRLFGLMDPSGKWLTRPRYTRIDFLPHHYEKSIDSLPPADETRYLVTIDDENGHPASGVIDDKGREDLKPSYDDIIIFFPYLNVYLVTENERYGVVQSNGEWRIPPINTSLAPISPPNYLLLKRPSENAGGSSDEEFYVLYNIETGKPVIDDHYTYLSVNRCYFPIPSCTASSDFFTVIAKRDGKYGVLGLNGRVLQPFVYDNFGHVDSWGRATFYTDGKEVRLSTLSPEREAKLHALVSHEIRSEPAALPSKENPFAGRYVPVDFNSPTRVAAAARNGQFSRPVAPMLVTGSRYAVIDADMVRTSSNHKFNSKLKYCLRANGFDILVVDGPHKGRLNCSDSPALKFRTDDGNQLDCKTCADFGLPERWQRTPDGPLPQ